MPRGWTILAALLQWGCGSCTSDEGSTQELTLPPIEGGLESAEALAQAWFDAIEAGDGESLETLVLSIEQLDQIVECGDGEERDRLAKS